jgi:hypothetical protein
VGLPLPWHPSTLALVTTGEAHAAKLEPARSGIVHRQRTTIRVIRVALAAPIYADAAAEDLRDRVLARRTGTLWKISIKFDGQRAWHASITEIDLPPGAAHRRPPITRIAAKRTAI